MPAAVDEADVVEAAGASGLCNADGSRPNGAGDNAVPSAVSNAPSTEACFGQVQKQTGKTWQQVCGGSYADWQAFHGKMLDCYGATANGKPVRAGAPSLLTFPGARAQIERR